LNEKKFKSAKNHLWSVLVKKLVLIKNIAKEQNSLVDKSEMGDGNKIVITVFKSPNLHNCLTRVANRDTEYAI
jgi:hypothetical protein